MMRTVGWGLFLGFWTVFAAFLHYTLPQKDIVYVNGTEIIREDFSGWNRIFYAQTDSGNADNPQNRDLRLINTTQENGKVMVYRNEDTGFGWPPYFKYGSSNLQAQAQGAISNQAEPSWYLITHYGWRAEVLSIYPNIISLKPIDGPQVGKPLPWVNIILLTALTALISALWLRWRKFRARRLDPALDGLQNRFEAASDAMVKRRSRLRRWFKS
jgi:hypothetical protein